MTDVGAISWTDLTKWRVEGHARFGGIHDVPIVDLNQEMRSLTGSATRLLDVGAGAIKPLRAFVDEQRTVYRTLDPDPAGEFDYASVDDIPDGTHFDLAVANQVFEHLTVMEALELANGLGRVLEPGGRLVATIPNAAHPVRQWADATHVTAWGLYDFYGLFRSVGLEVEALARYGKKRLPFRPWRRYVVRTIAREFRIDWCDSLLIVARRAV